MSNYILEFQETDKTKIAMVGGKGASLGELSRLEDVQVPGGFCVTTDVYKEMFGNNPAFISLLESATRSYGR